MVIYLFHFGCSIRVTMLLDYDNFILTKKIPEKDELESIESEKREINMVDVFLS